MKNPTVQYEHRVAYPQEARDLGIEGTVRARVWVGSDGQVQKVRVLSGPGFGLNQAARTALRKFRFAAAKDAAGRPRPAQIVYGYTFRLED